MRVLLLTMSFPPEITGTANLYRQLAESLMAAGHEVTVATPMPRQRLGESGQAQKRKYSSIFLRENIGSTEVLRMKSTPLPLSHPIGKGLDHIFVPLSVWIASQYSNRPDVILAYSPPLLLGVTAHALARKWGVPFVFNVQDIFPQYAIDARILSNPLLISFFRKAERWIYRQAAFIAVHSQGNMDYLTAAGVASAKLCVIPNWVDTTWIQPGNAYNDFRHRHCPEKAFVVSYAGTMGWAQGLEEVIQAAEELRDHEEIQFLLAGDGPRRAKLAAMVRDRHLQNVSFLPLQPAAVYPELLRASDVCLLSLNSALSTPVVPGKLMDIMAAGRPVVACLPGKGGAREIVHAAECGITVPAGDGRGLARAILAMYSNRAWSKELGRRGRVYAEKNFSKDACTAQYRDLLQTAAEETTGHLGNSFHPPLQHAL